MLLSGRIVGGAGKMVRLPQARVLYFAAHGTFFHRAIGLCSYCNRAPARRFNRTRQLYCVTIGQTYREIQLSGAPFTFHRRNQFLEASGENILMISAVVGSARFISWSSTSNYPPPGARNEKCIALSSANVVRLPQTFWGGNYNPGAGL